MVGFETRKMKTVLNRPIAIGFSILDLSKLKMYDFHYNQMKPLYGDKIKLMYTDTDSLVCQVDTEDIFKDMMQIRIVLIFPGMLKIIQYSKAYTTAKLKLSNLNTKPSSGNSKLM